MKKNLNFKIQNPNKIQNSPPKTAGRHLRRPKTADRQNSNKFRSFGFTLIELLVVISIIGVLAALIMVNFNAARERARDVQRKSDLDQIKKALRMYYNDNNSYPATGSLSWGSIFQSADGNMVYMRVLPHDPSWKEDGDPDYNYTQTEGGQDFCLWTTLENKSDGDIAKSKSRCSGCSVGTYDYVVCAD